MHISADVQKITGRTEQLHIFCHVTGFTSDYLSFIVVEHIRFFHRAIQMRAHTKRESAKPRKTGYKMRKYTWNYFCSLFTCTAVSAKSDCHDTDWQAVVWPWRASISRIIGLLLALTSQSRPLFKPTYEDERLPYTTLNNIALLLCLLYIAAPMNDRCTRIFNIAYRPNLWVAVTSSHGLLVAVNFRQRVDFVNVVLCD